MIGRLTKLFALAAAAILTTQPTEAQERFRVLVPDFYAQGGARANFGRDAAEQLRTQLEALRTHAPITEDDLDDALDEFDLDMEELDCLKTRQLATSMNAQIALCVNYTETGETRTVTGIQFWDMTQGEALDVPEFTVTGRPGIQEAAAKIFQAFDGMVQLARAQQFCVEYAISEQWTEALTNCERALELNPQAIATRERKARIHFQQSRAAGISEADKTTFLRQSLEELNKVLAINEFHEASLQLAGFVSVQLGDQAGGRRFYDRYLEVNPGADDVRRNIAYDMSQAGDPEGAMALVKKGLDANPENAQLLTDYAGYAFQAAQLAQAAGQRTDAGAMPPAAAAHYRDVISTLTKLQAMQGAETGATQLRMIVGSHIQLAEYADAERVANQVLATTPNDQITLSFLADAQQKQGRVDDAVATVSRIEAAFPDTRAGNIQVRQANWLMEAGRLQDALPYLRRAVERGEDANQISRLVFNEAVNKGVRTENWSYAVSTLQAAKSFAIDATTKQDYDFWHGFALYNQGIALQRPQTLESARAAMPVFESARDLLTAGRPAAARFNINAQQLLDAVNQYIEIQTVIIRRYGE
jgi:tetratricopeptide (TPR) repeat protein